MPRITVEAFNALVEAELPFAHELGLRIESIGRGRAVGRLRYRDSHLRPGGTLAGPVLVALADFTMYAVTLSAVRGVALAVTTNLTINFLRRPAPADVIAEGRVLKAGKRLVVSEVSMRSDGSDDLIAHVTGTYSIPPETGR
jgi:uncharacterized protein (TIGR00369 family)